MKRLPLPVACVAITMLVSFASPCVGADSEGAGTFSLHFENGLFGDTDQNYTSGFKLSWVSPDLTQYRDSRQLPQWSHKWIDMLPFIHEPGLQRNVVLSLGQSMYTPEDISRSDLIVDDRPYAGWLYVGTAFHNKHPTRLDTIELQFGVIGPWSLAEDAQNYVHELRGFDRPRGWQHQLDNEPGVAMIYERKLRAFRRGTIRGLGFDIVTHFGGALGNVYTYLNAGGEIRAGWNVPSDFGSSLIRPGGDTNAPIAESDPRRPGGTDFSLHVFASAEGRAVARDIFLDGNTFEDSHSIDKRYFVADFALGASVIYDRYKLSFARAVRTREFRRQSGNHHFGSVTLSVTF